MPRCTSGPYKNRSIHKQIAKTSNHMQVLTTCVDVFIDELPYSKLIVIRRYQLSISCFVHPIFHHISFLNPYTPSTIPGHTCESLLPLLSIIRRNRKLKRYWIYNFIIRCYFIRYYKCMLKMSLYSELAFGRSRTDSRFEPNR